MSLRPVLAVVALALVASGCAASNGAGNGLPSAAPSTPPGKIAVVAAESLWGNVAAQIGGSRVAVTSIISDPNQDPHDYESGVGDAATIAAADVVIVNGADYDPFMSRLLDVDQKSGRSVVTVSKIVGAEDGDNPHLWYDPTYVLQAAAAIEKSLAAKQPAHAARFAAGLSRFRTGEARVQKVIANIRARYRNAKVGYTEPVPGYLVDAAGLRLGTPKAFSLALENGTDPTPGDSAHFEQAISDHTIKVLLLNTQVVDAETNRLRSLADSSGVPVVRVTETLPEHLSFQGWQAGQASALLRALGG